MIGLPAVRQALRIMTGVFAMTPLLYYRTGAKGKERAEGHPLYKLFKLAPNPAQTAFAFKETMLADILLSHGSVAYVSRNFRQDPTALTRLDPNTTIVRSHFSRESGSELFFDATLPDGDRGRFDASEVWYVPGFSRDGVAGLHGMTAMRESLGGALATQEYANRFFANGAVVPTVLQSDQKISPEAKAQIKADWKARQAGVANAHDTAVLDGGLKLQQLATDNEKSQMIETRTFNVFDVARLFGIPPHLLFELSKATFSNIEQQSLEFIIYHMGPHYERVAQSATKSFADDGFYFEFLTDALLKGDVAARWAAYKAAREIGVLNADEIRSRENLNEIGGVSGGAYLWPANFNRAGESQDQS
jgi:HK97 family phage portal protein